MEFEDVRKFLAIGAARMEGRAIKDNAKKKCILMPQTVAVLVVSKGKASESAGGRFYHPIPCSISAYCAYYIQQVRTLG